MSMGQTGMGVEIGTFVHARPEDLACTHPRGIP